MEKFSGNFLFASLNSCRGNNKSRRDDIQSCLYIMVYLLNKNYLPWCDFHKKFKDRHYEFKDFLHERLEIKYTKDVFKLIPKDLREISKRIFTLTFEEEPPYDQIINAIKSEMKKDIKLTNECQPVSHVFEWANSIDNRIKANILKEHSERSEMLSMMDYKNQRLDQLNEN